MKKETITFTIFADLHYYQDRYIVSVKDLKKILNRARNNKSNFVIHCGDFCNDYKGSPEIINAYLEQELPAYGVCGNHETEGVGNTRSFVKRFLNNRHVVWGSDDDFASYYYFDMDEFRVIGTDTNYYFNGNQWVTYNNGEFGPPTKFMDTCNSLGEPQLLWLEKIIADAEKNGKKCMVISHATFNDNWPAPSPDAKKVRDIYARHKGTVILSVNGHYHTNNSAQIIDNVLYLDINTVRNGACDFSDSFSHYEGYTFEKTYYDEQGNEIETKILPIHEANWLAKHTWDYDAPLSADITVNLKTGEIEVKGMKANWLFDITAPHASDICVPEISSGKYKIQI